MSNKNGFGSDSREVKKKERDVIFKNKKQKEGQLIKLIQRGFDVIKHEQCSR